MARWEIFQAPLELHAINDEEGTFSGYASVFGSVVETWMPTVIHRGAFTKTLKEQNGKIKVLWQHEDPIGLPTFIKEDTKGLYVEAKLTLTQKVKEYLMLMKDGVVDALSIGWTPVKYDFAEDKTVEGGMLRHIRELRLFEFSCCLWGADPKALITEVHSLYDRDWSQADHHLLQWLDYRLTQDTDLLPAEVQRVLAAQALLQRAQGTLTHTLTRVAHRLEPMAAVPDVEDAPPEPSPEAPDAPEEGSSEPEEETPETPEVPEAEASAIRSDALAYQREVINRIAQMEAITAMYTPRR